MSQNWVKAIKIGLSNRFNHSSPNSGYPEAAIAGILNLKLGGPNFYGGVLVNKPYINKEGNSCALKDINDTWKIIFRASIYSLFLLLMIRFLVTTIIFP
ncbi:MAG: cobalamin biosynthesis protein [Desulfobacterales bacterium]|nr:cobalamin biosynthesis protein [Desulfobacterales bacterium]